MSCSCCKTVSAVSASDSTEERESEVELASGEGLKPEERKPWQRRSTYTPAQGDKSDKEKSKPEASHSSKSKSKLKVKEKGGGDAMMTRYQFPKQPDLSSERTWKDLVQLKKLKRDRMSELFSADSNRFKKYSIELTSPHGNILLDYSKNWFNASIFTCLMKLLKERNIDVLSRAMFCGERLNFTENKAVLHMALRNRGKAQIVVDGKDIMAQVNTALNGMKEFSEGVIKGTICGDTKMKFTDCVTVGTGGCYLGSLMVTEALKPFRRGPKCHFLSNIDGTNLVETLKELNAETTLIIIASKDFIAPETMVNAEGAKTWLIDKVGDEEAVLKHMVAVTADKIKAMEFGIDEKYIFDIWSWVNDRYSLWSPVGLPIAVSLGMDNYLALLEGAHHMDDHFLKAPMEQNMPMVLAALGIWYSDFHFLDTQAILAYDQYLHRFPSYIQHIDMESNGKSVTRSKTKVACRTAPVVWGEPGTNSQHGFHQLFHQGTFIVPCDFIVPIKTHNPLQKGLHHNILVSNCLAQTEALMKGKTFAEVEKELKAEGMSSEAIKRTAPHKVVEGDRPSNTIILQQINPFTLGMLIAMYEMKTFVQGSVWGINSFDHYGMDLGKSLAPTIEKELDSEKDLPGRHDSSTNGLLKHIRQYAPKMYRPYKDLFRSTMENRNIKNRRKF